MDRPERTTTDENRGNQTNRQLTLTSLLPLGESLLKSAIAKDATPLMGGFLCMLAADPKDREKELKGEAKKKFPRREDIQLLYVQDRMSKEFPDSKYRPLGDEHRAILSAWEQFPDQKTGDRGRSLVKKEVLGWLGNEKKHPPLTHAELSELNIMRRHPHLPEDLKKLAVQREKARLDGETNPLGLEDNARLDAWVSLPRGTKLERENLGKKLITWRKLDRGEMPGNDDVQKLAETVRNRGKLAKGDIDKLAAWRQFPYSTDFRGPDWGGGAPVFADDAAAAKFYNDARALVLKQRKGALTTEDIYTLGAYKSYANNPRMFDLSLRNTLYTLDKVKYAAKKLTPEEDAERAAWLVFKDTKSPSSARGRELHILKTLRPKEFTQQMAKELTTLVSLEAGNRR